ncbi:NAD dependent epimerase/dehydratase family protein [Methyloligella halotolerans]|uniref:NAD dependent epimerase/dehydratase family protein n=1 Tax=Methyloligella halotolerans TaxID=1177755 RepID=A0A1E2S0E5_9HYPH|nr:SDR family oxidoreductase [Methyloligella halotolerans]ODA67808.1 NAD dependent epimerase/dehydratase family protein [Methyloligella halotolerans]
MSKLFCFGLGFSAEALSARLKRAGWEIAGTVRSEEKADRLRALGYNVVQFDGPADKAAVLEPLQGATHLLLSIPPRDGDPALELFRSELAGLQSLEWIGYLSTVGVYGDHEGASVDESTPPKPEKERSIARVEAEAAWLALGEEIDVPTQVFRLAGIYGPGRSAVEKIKDGTAKRIVKPGQVFSRIHVEDIATVVEASIARPRQGAIYNVADDEPAPPQDVIAYAAELLDVTPPPEVPFEEADMSPMARSFYSERRRIMNDLIKSELKVALAYPNYRAGLRSLVPPKG